MTDEYVEIAYGRERSAVREQVAEWFRRHGLDMTEVDDSLIRMDVGRDLDGRTFYRCRVHESLAEAGGH